MQLNILDDTSVKDVQYQFNNFFPFLQIRFFKNTCCSLHTSCTSANVQDDEPVKGLMKINCPLQLHINRETRVCDLMKSFSDCGLRVQLYRKFGTFWIQTSLTDDWSLERQNQEAQILNMPIEKLLPENITIH